LSTKLKRIVEALTVAALSIAVLAALAGTAEAQGTAFTEADRGTDRVVVAPGDSLWSISQERLGPQATPQRIDLTVERIYTLNQNRIGPDPDLIFPGQELLLPPTVGQPASAGATPAREATGAAQARPKGRAADGEAEQAARTTVVAQKKKSPDRVAEAPNLPDAVEAPALRSAAVDTSPRLSVAPLLEHANSTFASAATALGETFARIHAAGWRLLLVVGTWLLTFALVVLMVWMLPMRRTTRSEAERWGIPTGYGKPNFEESSLVPSGVRRRSRRSPGHSPALAGAAGGETNSGDQTGDVKPPKRGRVGPVRAPDGRPSPSGRLALAAHDATVRRAALRARTRRRARKDRAASSRAARRPRPLLRPGRHARPEERGVEER
jgi:LysM repeat protein